MFRVVPPTLIAILTFAAAASASSTTTRPSPPLIYHEEIRTNPPLRLYSVIADLTNPAVHVKVSRGGYDPNMTPPWEATLLTVSGMAKRDGLTAAVNGSPFMCKDFESILGQKYPYYDGNWARAVGWTMSDGVLFSNAPKYPDWSALILTAQNRLVVGSFVHLPAGTKQAVTGVFQVVRNGRNNRMPDDAGSTLAPRTAAGTNQDGTKLILLVIDGRRPSYSVGVTEHQLGQEMIHLGAWNAIGLDSGGSSTMVVRDSDGRVKLVNRPSDGHDFLFPLSIERSVPDALGVIVDNSSVGAGSDPNN